MKQTMLLCVFGLMLAFAPVLCDAAVLPFGAEPDSLSDSKSKLKNDRRQTRKLKRQQRMEQWQREMDEFNAQRKEDDKVTSVVDSISAVQALAAMNMASFVLEADNVTFRRGYRRMVNNNTNFISLDGNRAVIQVAPSDFHSGPNGVGGVTVQGSVSSVELISEKDEDDVVFRMNVSGIGVSAHVLIRMNVKSNRATATITPNFNSNIITMDGWIVPFEMSSVIEGMAL